MEIISVTNQKGGVAKTTSAVNIATALASKGFKVCLIDFDPQGNVALSFGYSPNSIDKTIFSVIMQDCSIQQAIWKTHYKVDVIASNRKLAGFDSLVEQNRKDHSPALWLKEALYPLKGRYDYIVIDNPPELGYLTINSLAASNSLIIPMQADVFAESGLVDLMNMVQTVRETANPYLEILGLFFTIQEPIKTNFGEFVTEDIRNYCAKNGIRVFNSAIKRSIRFKEAVSKGQPAITYSKNDATQAYIKLVEEILNDKAKV